MDITNEQLFETFNLSVGEQARLRGHEWVESVDGPEPEMSAYNVGVSVPKRATGWVLHKKAKSGPDREASNEDVLGIPLAKLVADHVPGLFSRTLKDMGHKVTIHVNEWRPFGVKDVDKLKAIVMLHGVPTSAAWKAQMGRRLARQGYVVYAVDMLGMGRSTKIMSYTLREGRDEGRDNVAWDWASDVHWMEDFIRLLRLEIGHKSIGCFADDWGGGILMRYLSAHPEPGSDGVKIDFAVFTDPIWGDGYPVYEIATIGMLANLLKSEQFEAFDRAVLTLPQAIIGILKYMVVNREKFNRWTESTWTDQYRDSRYQEGRAAKEMGVNHLNLAVLAARSGSLASDQLQPLHRELNPRGVDYVAVRVPVHLVWGVKDQMMPPSQALTAVYRFPNARVIPHFVPDADHFAEIDNPEWVANIYQTICVQEWGKGAVPVYIGGPKFLVYKGDEPAVKIRLSKLYGSPVVYDAATLERLARPIEEDSAKTLNALREVLGGKKPATGRTTSVRTNRDGVTLI